jgi:hypothetical protein
MELAIPLLALGGAYIISNDKNDKKPNKYKNNYNNGDNNLKKESFVNMGKPKQNSYLPNTNIKPINYPVENLNKIVETVKTYPNPNVATDKYFNQNLYQTSQVDGVSVSNNIQQVYSLTGDYLDSKEFKHNNMVPFYGAKIKGQLYGANMGETILDNMVGSGSQTIKKIEQAPLFKPEQDMQWAFGTPNMSDFFQSRVNPGMNNANVKPFETENVGPGLGLGYTTKGSGGYNSGMAERDSWLPKTVDELRVSTNPKTEFSLDNHQGPATSSIQNAPYKEMIGRVEKNLPDTFFIQTQDRWLTTTGQEKGQALRPIQEIHYTARNDTTQPYMGVANADKNASYCAPSFEQSKRNELPKLDVPHSNAAGRGTHEYLDNALKSHTSSLNNRANMRQPDTMRSGFGGAIGAVIAPIMDIFRPTRKSEVACNLRVYGGAGSEVNSGYVLNPNDVTPVTIKETTLYSPNFFVGNQMEGGGYLTNEQQAISNQRDNENCNLYGAGGNASGYRSYESDYLQTNNDTKEISIRNRPNQGNMGLLNSNMNVSVGRIDSDRDNTRMWVPTNMPQLPMSKETYGKIRAPQYYDECKIGCDRIQPDILNAFKNNPYTQSLTTSV